MPLGWQLVSQLTAGWTGWQCYILQIHPADPFASSLAPGRPDTDGYPHPQGDHRPFTYHQAFSVSSHVPQPCWVSGRQGGGDCPCPLAPGATMPLCLQRGLSQLHCHQCSILLRRAQADEAGCREVSACTSVLPLWQDVLLLPTTSRHPVWVYGCVSGAPQMTFTTGFLAGAKP